MGLALAHEPQSIPPKIPAPTPSERLKSLHFAATFSEGFQVGIEKFPRASGFRAYTILGTAGFASQRGAGPF